MKMLICILSLTWTSNVHAIDLSKIQADLKKHADEKRAERTGRANPAAAQADLPPSPVCHSTRANLCWAFTGPANAEEKTAKGNEMACKMMKGKLAPSSQCPSQRLLGRCKILAGDPKEYVLHYYGFGNSKKAQADCANPKSSMHAQGAGVWL